MSNLSPTGTTAGPHINLGDGNAVTAEDIRSINAKIKVIKLAGCKAGKTGPQGADSLAQVAADHFKAIAVGSTTSTWFADAGLVRSSESYPPWPGFHPKGGYYRSDETNRRAKTLTPNDEQGEDSVTVPENMKIFLPESGLWWSKPGEICR